MGIFGWSLPAGCGTLPGEEEGASDLSHLIPELPEGAYAYWHEDGALLVQIGSERELRIGRCDWDDEQTDDQNLARAAALVRDQLAVIVLEREQEARYEQRERALDGPAGKGA